MDNWISVKDRFPENKNKRVLVFSPSYSQDDPFRLRLIDSQFVKICTDVTHWCYPEEPKNNPK